MKIKELTADSTKNSLQVIVQETTVAEMVDFFHSLKDINEEFTCNRTKNVNEVSSIVTYENPEEYERVYKLLKEKFNAND